MTTRRAFAGALVATAAAPRNVAQPPRPPNLVLIVTDDQGWWDVGVNGNRVIETPVMDQLAADGVQLTRFYACPVCAPTRASLMTGRDYLRTGVYNTRFGGDTLHAGEVTLADVLRRQGYRTGLFGKWHLGQYRRYHPNLRGFDESLSFAPGHLERYFYPDRLERDGRPVEARGHVTDLFTDGAIQFVRHHRARPFFLYLAYNAPHAPNYAANPDVERYLRKGVPLNDAQVYGMVTHVDRGIGRLLAALDEERLSGNTVVVFMSDNGGVSRHFRAGLRGAKASAFEGGLRVPFFVRWPGRFPAGAKVDAMAGAADVFPTFCELAGEPLPTGRPINGRSLVPLLRDGAGESPHEHLFHIWDRHRPSLGSAWAVTGRRYKLVGRELFDILNDPGERSNLAAEQPAIAADLRRRFEAWLADATRGQSFTPVPIEVGRADENPVELQASWARLNGTHVTWPSPGMGQAGPEEAVPGSTPDGGVNYTFAGYDWDTIDGWTRPGASAAWVLEVVRAGRYRVTASYGAETDSAGGTFAVSVGPAQVEATVASTGSRHVFERRPLGALDLPKGPATLEVRVASSRGRELMALNRLWLERE